MLPLLLLLVAAAIALPAAPASASPTQVMTFEAPRELLSDADRDATLDQIRAFGVRRVRVLMYWNSIAPDPGARRRPSGFDGTDPGAYPASGWGRYDNLMQAAQARGIEVYVTLTGPAPRWATKNGDPDGLVDPDPEAFGAFATAAGRRYGDRVAIWSIWNEPNQPQFLRPQFRDGRAASPALYRKLFQRAEAGLEASGNGGDAILMGETSPRGNSRIVAPLAFLRGTLCLSASYRKRASCGRLDADGYAHHPYSRSTGPRTAEPIADNVTMSGVSRLVRALDRAAAAGAVRKRLPVYLTEFGTQSTPDPGAASLAQQAEYNAISERLAYLNRRVASFSQYLMTDDDPRAGGERYGGFESGLRRFDGRAKPAYDGFRTPLVVTDYGSTDTAWGLIRPATAPTVAEIQYRNRGAKSWRTLRSVTTRADGTFSFKAGSPAGRRYRVRWTAPDGTVYTGPPIRSYG
jgi:Cellulase (glycosyl hydrolase family 5)